MRILIRSLDRFIGRRKTLHKSNSGGWVAGWLFVGSLLWVHTGFSQQTLSFSSDGYTYHADINWVIKNNNAEYRNASAHQFDKSLDATFDLVVFFKFKYDSIPPDQDIVWGFQFNQGGGIITPARNEKRTRSLKIFQRFQLTGTGEANLVISPKAWKKNRSNQYESLDLAQPFKLTFSINETGVSATAQQPGSGIDSLVISPIKSKEIPVPVSEHLANTEIEIQAFKKAISEIDSTQKIKALLDFVDKYAPEKPKSALVTEAIKNVPLGTSLPKTKGDGTYSYTLNYAVNPVIDSGSVKGWDYRLSKEKSGQYQLTLKDRGESVHEFKIADLGKNAPFNRPREIRPFDKVQVSLLGENSESFQLRIVGGVPPFIVFLSQNRVPKARFIFNQTDTLYSISKDACKMCKSGAHTLEVYNNDFSTLLLRADSAIHIFRINYYYLGLIALAIVLVIYFLYKPITRARQRYVYERRLRDIEDWEKRDNMEGK